MSLRLLLATAAASFAAERADAAEARLVLSLRDRPWSEALIDLGLRANVSVLGTGACGPGGRVSLSGAYTLRGALDRILTDAPCTYRIVDGGSVRILPIPPARQTGAASAPARAQPPLPQQLQEIVVTATKRPALLGSLPAGVSAVGRDQIDSLAAVDIGRTVGQLAGVMTTNLGPGRDKLLIRGLSDGAFTGRTRSTVATYLDDAPINDNAPDPDLRLVDIDRVEVVRGPQGALYGSGAMAGIYRIVTRKPEPDRYAAGLSSSIAWTRGGDPSRDLDGYLNLPLPRLNAAVRAVAYSEVQGGYLDNVNLRIANVDQTRRQGGRLAFRAQITDSWRLDLLAATQALKSNDTQYVVVSASRVAFGETAPQAAPAQRANRIQEGHRNDFTYVGGSVTGQMDWGTLTSSLSYVQHNFSSNYDASAAIGVLAAAQVEDLGVYSETARVNLLVQDLVLRSSGPGRLQWLVGAYGARTIERTPAELGILTPGAGVSTAYTEYRKDRVRETALYGEGSYDIGDGWTATAGARLFQLRVQTTADISVIQPYGPRFFDAARTFEGLSPKLTLQRTFHNGDLVYGLFTEGFRPGGYNSSGFLPIRASRISFSPDRLRNLEVGAKLRRLDGRFSMRVAGYYNDWQNIQTDQYRPSGLGYTANVGDARIMGVEAEAGYAWPAGLALQVNGLIAGSAIRNPNSDFATRITGALPGVPRTSGGLLVTYTRPVPGGLTLKLIGEASYIGRSALSFDANLSPEMGRYLRAQLAAELAAEHWRLSAFVNNPQDNSGDTFAYGNPFTFGQVRQITPQRPRTVGLRLAAGF